MPSQKPNYDVGDLVTVRITTVRSFKRGPPIFNNNVVLSGIVVNIKEAGQVFTHPTYTIRTRIGDIESWQNNMNKCRRNKAKLTL
jgi:hypothetical protein